MARGLVALLLGAGVHPDDAVPLAGGKRRGRDLPDLVGVAVALAGPARRLGELRGGGAHPVPELGVLAPRAWQHGDEPAAGLVDVAHLLARAQLAVGDVEEVGAASQRAQLVPRVDVRLVVVGVAGRQAMRQRDGAVGGHGQDQHELLEVGAVVLGMAAGRDRGRLAAPLVAVGGAVVAVQHDRRRVVVQLRAVDPELAHRCEHQLGQQRGAIAVEQCVQGAADAVVVEQLALPGPQARQARLERGGPAGQAVERLARHAQVAHQHADSGRGRERRARVARGQVTRKRARHVDALKEPVDQRQRPELA